MSKGVEPAFPVANSMGDIYSGMTLRDFFAAMAMQGACISVGIEGAVHREMEVSTAEVARDAYKMADAMLAARDDISGGPK